MRHSGSRRLTVGIVVVLLGLVVAGAAIAWKHRSRTPAASSKAPPHDQPPVVATLPEFVLENERGESVGLVDFHGTVWIADFIFTRCQAACPALTRSVATLARELRASSALQDVRIVSFSVDPDVDTPEVLRAYAQANGADPARWSFLTGTRDAVRGLITRGFRLPVADVDDAKMPILHSSSLVVIDREGRVRGAYDGMTDDGRRQLVAALTRVIAEPPPQDIYVPDDVTHPAWLEPRRTAQLAAAKTIAADTDFRFTDAIGASGITFVHGASMDLGKYFRAVHYDHGTAVAAADVDGDGLVDLFFANQVGKNGLYRNLGHGTFADVTAAAGVGVGDRACVGASFADIDNDGAPDLFVTSVRAGNLLFHNDGRGHFTDVTEQAGVRGHNEHASGSVFFDYDRDGLLDLFVTNVGRYTLDERRPDGLWAGMKDAFAGHLHPDRAERSLLYHNLGGGKFEDVTERSGLVDEGWSGDASAFDYDDDGLPDLYVLSMQGHDELWRNLGGGRFERTGRTVFPRTPWGAMGVKVFDWNGDARLDLYVTDMHTDMAHELAPEAEKRKHDPATMYPQRFLATDGNHVLGNALFTGDGHGSFTERSDEANVETGWPWGPSVGDLNADGWPDIFVTQGMSYNFRYGPNAVLLNEGGRRFADAEFIVGVEPRARLARPWFELDCDGADAQAPLAKGRHGRATVWGSRSSRSSVVLDVDGDGDLDIVTNTYGDVPQVLTNDLAQRRSPHFVTIELRGRRSNRDGVGARVTVRAGGRAQLQVNDGKSGYLAQSVLPLYVGLGEVDHADAVEVRWPSGETQVVRGPLKSGAHVVVEERP